MDRLKIGISACFFHPDPGRKVAASKTLQFIEQSTAHWVMSLGALPFMVPAPSGDTFRGDVAVADYAQALDGIVMHGGADVWPGSYGEEPLRPEWTGDRVRDEYEMALVRAFSAAGKPVFGICRGLQLINVAFGGTLYQDISTQQPGAPCKGHARCGHTDQNLISCEIDTTRPRPALKLRKPASCDQLRMYCLFSRFSTPSVSLPRRPIS
mgnify:CR=1 FL=1